MFDPQDRTDGRRTRERETTIIMYIKKIYIYHPLLAGVTYLAVEDLSIDNEEVSMIESSYCSPSSLCFSTRKKRMSFSRQLNSLRFSSSS